MSYAYVRRLNERNEEILLKTKKYSLSYLKNNKIKKVYYMGLESFTNLVEYHFNKYNINFLNKENSYCNNLNCFKDFRDGSYFKNNNIFQNHINLNNNLFLYNVYMDGTKIFKREVINVYLEFVNDFICKNLKKKIIYNLFFIENKFFKLIKFSDFTEVLFLKLKELENGFYININNQKTLVYGNLFSMIGDNKEIYKLLNFKINFGTSNFLCRICDHENNSEKLIDYYDNYIIRSNESVNEGINLIKKYPDLLPIYSISELSNIFILDNIDIINSFPLEVQHIEFEGEVPRSIILFFLMVNDIKSLDGYSLMINYIKKNFINNEKNIIHFFNNIHFLKFKIFEYTALEKEINRNKSSIQKKNEKKFLRKLKLNSGESMLIFSIIPYFFKEYFKKNLDKYWITSYLIHYKYLEILMKKIIYKNELNYLDNYIRQFLIIYKNNKVKVFIFLFYY